MSTEIYHPNAYLSCIKNVKRGLRVRTQLLNLLTLRNTTIKVFEKKLGRSYRVILHHLKLLEIEKIILKKGKKPYLWEITGFGQKSLNNWG
jgi:hypothetical protein